MYKPTKEDVQAELDRRQKEEKEKAIKKLRELSDEDLKNLLK